MLLLLVVAAPATLAQTLQTFPTGELTIESANGAHKFTVEIATTPAQMEQGLMFRRKMAPDAGMLFVFNTPSQASMWMKNTFIPLDMLFIDPEGRIINIAERRVPESLDTTGRRRAGPRRPGAERRHRSPGSASSPATGSGPRLSRAPRSGGGQRGSAMAILFRSTPAATARWRPLLADLLPRARHPLLARDRRP